MPRKRGAKSRVAAAVVCAGLCWFPRAVPGWTPHVNNRVLPSLRRRRQEGHQLQRSVVPAMAWRPAHGGARKRCFLTAANKRRRFSVEEGISVGYPRALALYARFVSSSSLLPVQLLLATHRASAAGDVDDVDDDDKTTSEEDAAFVTGGRRDANARPAAAPATEDVVGDPTFLEGLSSSSSSSSEEASASQTIDASGASPSPRHVGHHKSPKQQTTVASSVPPKKTLDDDDDSEQLSRMLTAEVAKLRDQNRALRLVASTLQRELDTLRRRQAANDEYRRLFELAEQNATRLALDLARTERLRARAASEVNHLRSRQRDVLARNAELEARDLARRRPSRAGSTEDRALRLHERRRRRSSGNDGATSGASSFGGAAALFDQDDDDDYFKGGTPPPPFVVVQRGRQESASDPRRAALAASSSKKAAASGSRSAFAAAAFGAVARVGTTTTTTTKRHPLPPPPPKQSVLVPELDAAARLRRIERAPAAPRFEKLADKMARGSSIYQQLQSELARRVAERKFGTLSSFGGGGGRDADRVVVHNPPRPANKPSMAATTGGVPPGRQNAIISPLPTTTTTTRASDAQTSAAPSAVRVKPTAGPADPRTETILAKLHRGSTLYMQIRQDAISKAKTTELVGSSSSSSYSSNTASLSSSSSSSSSRGSSPAPRDETENLAALFVDIMGKNRDS